MRTRLLEADALQDPVVDLTVVGELDRAERVRYAFDRVLQAVRKVVQRIDAPLVALPIMVRVSDPVEHGIAHEHVG